MAQLARRLMLPDFPMGTPGQTLLVDPSGMIIWSGQSGMSVADFGAAFDAELRMDGTFTAGSPPRLTSTGYTFTQADVGKTLIGDLSGASTYAAYVGTILGVAGGAATLSGSLSAGGSGVSFVWGTDDTAAWQAAITYALSNNCKLLIPAGGTIVTGFLAFTPTVYPQLTLEGAGMGVTQIYSTNQSGFLSIDASGAPLPGISGASPFFNIRRFTALTAAAGGGTALRMIPPPGSTPYSQFMLEEVALTGLSPNIGYWDKALQVLAMQRPRIKDVFVASLWGPNVQYLGDDGPQFLPTCGITLDNSYTPSLHRVYVWSCNRGIQNDSTSSGVEGWFSSELTIVGCREGLYLHDPDDRAQIDISGGHMNNRDYNICINNRKLAKWRSTLSYMTAAGFTPSVPAVLSNGGVALPATATSIPVNAVDKFNSTGAIGLFSTGEQFTYQGGSVPSGPGNLTTVVRGAFGTTAASVPDATNVYGMDANYLAAAINTGTTPTSVQVTSTAGAPRIGAFQIAAEWWTYNGLDATHFLNTARAAYGTVDPGSNYTVGTIFFTSTSDLIGLGVAFLTVKDVTFNQNTNIRRINLNAQTGCQQWQANTNLHNAQGYGVALNGDVFGSDFENNFWGQTGGEVSGLVTPMLGYGSGPGAPASPGMSWVTRSANYQMLQFDKGVVVTATCTITLPLTPVPGRRYSVKNLAAAITVTVTTGTTFKIDSGGVINATSTTITTQGAVMTFASAPNGKDWLVV